MDGILLIDKPAGWTSFDVVAKVRGLVRRHTGQKRPKVGHSGTLDPFATGLLVVLVGSYTKRQDEFMRKDKVYEAVLDLGKVSTTGDPEGEITEISGRVPTPEEIKSVLNRFSGEIEQTPPIYSAIKINGQRAYDLARAGKQVDLKSRRVTVYEIADVRYDYPELEFKARVSSGTYIRSLAADIGEGLDCGAYLKSLRRLSSGELSVHDSVKPESLEADNLIKHLLKTD